MYYTLDGNITIPISRIQAHCTVSGEPDVTADFYCFSAIDARKGIYYEFQWEELHAKAVEMPDISEGMEQWNLSAQEITNTPAKKRIKHSQLAFKEDEISFGGVLGLHKHRKSAASDDELPMAKPTVKRKQTQKPSQPFKRARKQRSTSSDNEVQEDKSSSSDDGSDSDEYTEARAASESEEDLAPDLSEDDAEEFEEEFEPRTPRKSRAAHPRTPRTPRTPHTKRGRPFKLAAPTPHSKAALRARASRKHARALPVQSLVGAHDLALLEKLPQDPWLRAMHVLHVASRPDALPCRQEEYGRISRAVEELLDEGSGGCVCACES